VPCYLDGYGWLGSDGCYYGKDGGGFLGPNYWMKWCLDLAAGDPIWRGTVWLASPPGIVGSAVQHGRRTFPSGARGSRPPPTWRRAPWSAADCVASADQARTRPSPPAPRRPGRRGRRYGRIRCPGAAARLRRRAGVRRRRRAESCGVCGSSILQHPRRQRRPRLATSTEVDDVGRTQASRPALVGDSIRVAFTPGGCDRGSCGVAHARPLGKRL
jgi:hypothetical protein